MASKNSIILIVDDNRDVLDGLCDIFCHLYDVIVASSADEAVRAAANGPAVSTVIMDIKMAGRDGISAAREIRAVNPDIPIIFHTGYPGEFDQRKIDENERPFDFVLKGEPVPRLVRAVRNAVETFQLRSRRFAGTEVDGSDFGMVGRTAVMQEVFMRIRLTAQSTSKVMILGETGTGKELVARAIHKYSPRSGKRFAVLNCNHKSADLIESELFGHLRGSFTTATSDRQGLFSYATGGTVFLDEIGDLDLTTQAKLLRVLDTGEYSPVGTSELSKCSVRVLCATHKDLPKLVAEGHFREDLFYRIKGVKVVLPPLRKRKEDIPALVEHFKDQLTVNMGRSPKVFDQSAIDVMIDYDWPGNVRQLLESVDALVTLTVSDVIFADDVASCLEIVSVEPSQRKISFSTQIREFERDLVLKALTRFDHNVSRTASYLGLDRANLARKIKSLGL